MLDLEVIKQETVWVGKLYEGGRITGTWSEIGHIDESEFRELDIVCTEGQPEHLRDFYEGYFAQSEYYLIEDYYNNVYSQSKEGSMTINFDSTNWDSIRETINIVNEIGEMVFTENTEGETMVFDVAIGADGHDMLKTTTYQKNGWIRENYYDLEDYTIEELYSKNKEVV